MSFISKLFGRSNEATPVVSPSSPSGNAQAAIRLAREGRITVKQMLDELLAGQLFVPLAAPPVMDGESIKSWKPATVSKADGSQWLVAFTSPEFVAPFTRTNPTYDHGLSLNGKWLLQAIPQGHGLVINLGTDAPFEWNAEGLARYAAIPR